MNNIVDFTGLQIRLASPDEIKKWSHGQITKPETINYRTQKPEKDGLFCERIFGPTKDWECYCGKYKRVRFKGIVCDKCGVEVTLSRVRRERMGHIDLAAPVSHVWFFKGAPSKLSLLLDISPKALTSVIYFSKYLVMRINEEGREAAKQNILEQREAKLVEVRASFDKQIEELKDKGLVELKDLKKKIKVKDEFEMKAENLKVDTKQKIAQLREKQESRVQKKTGSSEYGYSVRKSGDGTVLLLGFPSSGKSTLLNRLTDAKSEVGAYDFTTLSVVPGMMYYKQAKIQILDVPGIVSGAASGKGRGKEVLAVIRTADLILIVVDINHPEHLPAILREAWEADIRVNKTKPEVYITKKARGGINIGKTVPLEVEDETLKNILREFKTVNADVLIRSQIDVDDFIDCIETNKKYIPGIICLTKIDLSDALTIDRLKKELRADIAVSAENDINIEPLRELIFQKLDFMRVFMKEPGKEADLGEPLIIKKNSTVEDVCNKLHREMKNKFRFARIWGKSTKFPGQRLMLNHKLVDKDIVEIHLK